MVHLDLFSGIGGFAYALDQVYDDVEHIFCDNDEFCRQVLKKHWPESEVFSDIKEITADSLSERLQRGRQKQAKGQLGQPSGIGAYQELRPFILTGGFPCQPFSVAGLRKGTADNRYLWPEMLRVIRFTKPQWVIAENVRGLVTWNEGMVLEQVCSDLEAEGYEVQPFIIPACAVNAPHRRDRIWFIAHRPDDGRSYRWSLEQTRQGKVDEERTASQDKQIGQRRERKLGETDTNAQDPNLIRSGRRSKSPRQILASKKPEIKDERPDWESDWFEVATELCGVDDGFPKGLDRANQIKAYGNAIVPQVAVEIFRELNL